MAKQFATALTTHNVRTNRLKGETAITKEHVANNQTVRAGAKQRGVILENVKPEEDIKKVERRHASEAKKLIAPTKAKRPKAAKQTKS